MVYVILAMLVAGIVSSGTMYFKGKHDAASECQTAALEAQIKTLEFDNNISKQAEERAKNAAGKLEAQDEINTGLLNAYESELAEERAKEPEVIVVPGKPTAKSCSFILNDRDAARMLDGK